MLRKMSDTNNDLVNAQKMNIDLLDTNHLIQGPIVKVDRLYVRLSGKPENSSSRLFLDNTHSPGETINCICRVLEARKIERTLSLLTFNAVTVLLLNPVF